MIKFFRNLLSPPPRRVITTSCASSLAETYYKRNGNQIPCAMTDINKSIDALEDLRAQRQKNGVHNNAEIDSRIDTLRDAHRVLRLWHMYRSHY